MTDINGNPIGLSTILPHLTVTGDANTTGEGSGAIQDAGGLFVKKDVIIAGNLTVQGTSSQPISTVDNIIELNTGQTGLTTKDVGVAGRYDTSGWYANYRGTDGAYHFKTGLASAPTNNVVGGVYQQINTAGVVATGQVTTTGLKVDDGVNNVTILPPTSGGTNPQSIRLPSSAGTSGQTLINNGTGALSWVSPTLQALSDVSVSGSSALTATGSSTFNTGLGISHTFGGSKIHDVAVGNFATAGGSRCTSIGNAAGYQTTGDDSTYIGSSSGSGGIITTGSKNTFIGSGTGATFGDVSDSIAIGFNAKVDATGGIVIGTGAHTKGSYGIAIGYQAKGQDSTGIAIGYQASTGDDSSQNHNIAIGYQAMNSNTAGSQNTAVGGAALQNINAHFNTAIGFAAGQRLNGTSTRNVLIGTYAGDVVGSCTNNTLVGDSSNMSAGVDYAVSLGYNNTNTGDYSIAIGTGVSAAANKCVIGTGTSPATGIDQIYSDCNSDTVSLGTNSKRWSDVQTNKVTFANATNVQEIRAPISGVSNRAPLILPANDATANQVLSNNGSGQLSWTTPSAGVTTLANLSDVSVAGGVTPYIRISANPTFNTSLGSASDPFNTASGCVCIGFDATAFGNSSTSVGTASGESTGIENTAFGASALGNGFCLTGQRNTAIGFQASPNASDPSETIAVGYNSAPNSSYSIAIGSSAVTSGQYGLAIGKASQAFAHSVAIGHSVNAPANQVVFGTSTNINTIRSDCTDGTVSLGTSGHRWDKVHAKNFVKAESVILERPDGTSGTTIRSNQTGGGVGTLTLPASTPANGQILSSDNTGQLSWINPPSGGVTTLTGLSDVASNNTSATLIKLSGGVNPSTSNRANTILGSNTVAGSFTGSFLTLFGTNSGTSYTNELDTHSVIVGANTCIGGTGKYNTIIGDEAAPNQNGQGCIAIGFNSSNSANSANQTICIGQNTIATAGGAIALGMNANTSTANQLMIGGAAETSNAEIKEVVSGTPSTSTIGSATRKWNKVFTTTLNNGSDITIPSTAGTLITSSTLTLGGCSDVSASGTAPLLTVSSTPNNRTGLGSGHSVSAIGSIAIGKNAASAANGLIAIGTGTGSSVTSSATDSIYIGGGQGQTLSVPITGLFNTLIGGTTGVLYNRSQPSAANMVGLGYDARPDAFGAVAVGSGAKALSGYGVSIGLDAGNGSGAVNHNIAIGNMAGRSNVSGEKTIAIGSSALTGNLASDNIAIGTFSQQNTTSGTRNLSIGSSSLATNVSGSSNTMIGYSSDVLTNAQSHCVGLGDTATCQGNNSVSVGSQSVAGTGSIALGHLSTATSTNSIAIGQGVTNVVPNTAMIGNLNCVSIEPSTDNVTALGRAGVKRYTSAYLSNGLQFESIGGSQPEIKFTHGSTVQAIRSQANVGARIPWYLMSNDPPTDQSTIISLTNGVSSWRDLRSFPRWYPQTVSNSSYNALHGDYVMCVAETANCNVLLPTILDGDVGCEVVVSQYAIAGNTFHTNVNSATSNIIVANNLVNSTFAFANGNRNNSYRYRASKFVTAGGTVYRWVQCQELI